VKTEPVHVTCFNIFVNRLCGKWRDDWWVSAEAVWKIGTRIVPVGKELVAACVAAAECNACAPLHATLGTLVRPDVQEYTTCNYFFEALLLRVHTFMSDIYSQ
jgi:hypothetical protein